MGENEARKGLGLMMSIGQVSEMTGLSPYTLRYYEKIGVLQGPERSGGARSYTDADVNLIRCLSGLKKLGVSLEEITEFFRDGCVMDMVRQGESAERLTPSLAKRVAILTKHKAELEAKRRDLDQIISLTEDKLALYRRMAEELRGEGG